MPVAYLWGKAFNIPLSTLQSASSMLRSSGPHTTLLSHHQPGEAQLSVFNDLNSSQSDCDALVEAYTPRATTHHHHATVLIQEPDVVASRCYLSPPEVVPLLTVAFRSPLEQRRRLPSNVPKKSLFFLTRQSPDTTARFAQWIWQSSWCAPACAHSTSSPTSTSATFSSLTPWSSTQRRSWARSRRSAMSDLLNHCYQAARR